MPDTPQSGDARPHVDLGPDVGSDPIAGPLADDRSPAHPFVADRG
jgi:hypothetical protein